MVVQGGGSRAVGVFCGAGAGSRPAYAAAAEALGRLLADAGLCVVYGGGHVGLMGALADAALAGGGEVVGVIPRGLAAQELAHRGVTTLHVVDGMHERKALMATLSDVFVVLPGGFGTLEEAFEVLTWNQLGLHAKPCCFVNTGGFFDHLRMHLDRAVEEGFLRASHRAIARFVGSPADALDWVRTAAAPGSGRS